MNLSDIHADAVDKCKGGINCSYMDNISDTVSYPVLKHSLHVNALLCIVYVFTFAVALTGNSLVIAVVYRDPWMRNVTNFFVVNLAVADILVTLFCMPITLLDNVFTGWRFGAFLCKTTPYIQQVCVCASVTTLAVIAIDRYLAICNTWHSKISGFASRVIIFFVWVSSLVIAIPKAIFYERFERKYGIQVIPLCNEVWPQFDLQRSYFVVCMFLLCYTIPLTIIVICYMSITIRVWTRRAPGIANNSEVIQKSKIKVIKMFAIVVSLFALSWLPLYALYLKLYFNPPNIDSQEFHTTFAVLVPIFQWLGLSNSSINPLIYCKFSKKYRHGFQTLMKCKAQENIFQRNAAHASTYDTKLMSTEISSSGSSAKNKFRLYTPARFMSVHYSNGHMKVTFRKEDDETPAQSE